MTDVQLITEPLGGGALARAAVAGELPAWYVTPPAGPAAWRERLGAVRQGAATDWLTRLAPAFQSSGPAAERLARSADGRGVVVTTGQQPGLFGGPIYTWSKAVSALALADALERACGIPVAPVFWAATDDADFAEAADTWVAVPSGSERLTIPGDADATRPMSDVPLGDVSAQLAALRRGAGSLVDPAALEAAERAYAEGHTVGSAYLELLRTLLQPLGIAVLDAAHPAVRAASAPLLERALIRAASVEQAVARRTAEVEAAGFPAQVSVVDGLSTVFVYEAEGRRRVPLDQAAAVVNPVAGVAAPPLGPNVLLRPVVERAILPTVAYVAGPGEIAYFAQVTAVAEALDVVPPLVVPRWSVTLVEPHVARLLARLGLTMSQLGDPHGPERDLARSLMPAGVAGALHALRGAVATATDRLREQGGGLLPDAVPAGARRALDHRVDRIERRYRAAVRRNERDAFQALATVRAALRPGGHRQERALNLLPLLARHGVQLLERMRDAAGEHAQALVRGAAAQDSAARHTAAASAIEAG